MSALTADSMVVVRAQFVTDKYGNTSSVRDWAHATRTTVTGVSIQPNASSDSSTEASGDRPLIVSGWRVFSARGTDLPILVSDRVEFDGMSLEVNGEIARFHKGGRVHHAEAQLKRVEG